MNSIKFMYKPRTPLLLIILIASMLGNYIAATSNTPVFKLIIESHLFVPDVLVVPQHKVIKLVFVNQDNEAEEIISSSLNIRKIIHGHSQGFAIIGPLEHGDYALQGYFFPRTAVGIVRASN